MSHLTHIRVYYKDTDAGGVVYNTRYGEFLEIARTEMFRHLGLSPKEVIERYDLIFPVIELKLQYIKPAVYDTLLVIETKITKISPVRIFFEYSVKDESGTLYCTAKSVNCGVNRQTLKPKRFPFEFHSLVEKVVSNE